MEPLLRAVNRKWRRLPVAQPNLRPLDFNKTVTFCVLRHFKLRQFLLFALSRPEIVHWRNIAK